jgi:hypothetical protein
MSRNRRKHHSQMQTNPSQTEVDTHIGVAPAPDYIFKNRRNRAAPAQETWGLSGTISYLPDHAEYVDGNGNPANLVYYRGWGNQPAPLFPSKTIAPVEAIYAITPSKRLFINILRFLSTIHKRGRINRFFEYFNDVALMTLSPFLLDNERYCGTAKNVRAFTRTLLRELWVKDDVASQSGEIFGCFFEFDNAYRIRVQDMAGETTTEVLCQNLPKELNRLVALMATRENVPGDTVPNRFRSGIVVLKWLWHIPFFRNKLKKAIKAVDLSQVRMDEADFYHAILYGDYNSRGMDIDERIAIYTKYHGPDQSLWPPRIRITHQGNNW